MSNYPPPYGQPPQNQPPYGQPPQGYPPPGYPQPGGAYAAPAPAGANGWGIASLITGIVGFCVPFLGVLASIFGFLGLRTAKRTGSGRGLAIAGLVIGLVTIVGWLIFGGGVLAYMKGTAANRDLANQFMRDLAANKPDAAAAAVDQPSFKPGELAALAKYASGNVKDVTSFPAVTSVNGVTTAEVTGVITYADDSKKAFTVRQKQVSGLWKIDGVSIK